MAIFKAIGLGILILVLQSLAPAVLAQAESTIIAFLRGAEVSAIAATSLAASAANATEGARLPRTADTLTIPQARTITRF